MDNNKKVYPCWPNVHDVAGQEREAVIRDVDGPGKKGRDASRDVSAALLNMVGYMLQYT